MLLWLMLLLLVLLRRLVLLLGRLRSLLLRRARLLGLFRCLLRGLLWGLLLQWYRLWGRLRGFCGRLCHLSVDAVRVSVDGGRRRWLFRVSLVLKEAVDVLEVVDLDVVFLLALLSEHKSLDEWSEIDSSDNMDENSLLV